MDKMVFDPTTRTLVFDRTKRLYTPKIVEDLGWERRRDQIRQAKARHAELRPPKPLPVAEQRDLRPVFVHPCSQVDDDTGVSELLDDLDDFLFLHKHLVAGKTPPRSKLTWSANP